MQAQDVPGRHLWAEFLFSRVFVLVVSRLNYGDLSSYFEGASALVSKGTPYGEDGFGYPVLALLLVFVPWLLGATDIELYSKVFRAQCFAADVLLFYVLSRRCSRTALMAYVVSTAILANLLYTRLDIFLGLLLIYALVLCSRPSAGLVLGSSIAFKIIPIFLLPAWLLSMSQRPIRQSLRFFAAVALGAGLPFAFACALWGREAIFFLGTHAGRGVQLESIWASVAIVLMEFCPADFTGKVYFSAGSFNLSNPFEGAFATASLICAVAVSLWGGILALRLSQRGRHPLPAVTATLGALILVSKVFSPQYLLFFLPALAWCVDLMSPVTRRVTMALAVAICGLTTWVYPYHEKELIELAPLATVPLIGRNALLLSLVSLLQVHAWRSGSRRGNGYRTFEEQSTAVSAELR